MEDDLRNPNATNQVPAELPAWATWTSYTDFTVIPTHGHTTTLPYSPETKTTDSTDEDMPESIESTAASSTYLSYEWKIQGECFVRVHSIPRTALLTPSDLQDSPKLPAELTRLRITRLQCSGSAEVHESQDDITGPTSRLELSTQCI